MVTTVPHPLEVVSLLVEMRKCQNVLAIFFVLEIRYCAFVRGDTNDAKNSFWQYVTNRLLLLHLLY